MHQRKRTQIRKHKPIDFLCQFPNLASPLTSPIFRALLITIKSLIAISIIHGQSIQIFNHQTFISSALNANKFHFPITLIQVFKSAELFKEIYFSTFHHLRHGTKSPACIGRECGIDTKPNFAHKKGVAHCLYLLMVRGYGGFLTKFQISWKMAIISWFRRSRKWYNFYSRFTIHDSRLMHQSALNTHIFRFSLFTRLLSCAALSGRTRKCER